MYNGVKTPIVFHHFKVTNGYIKGHGIDTVGEYEIIG
jgi:hypothetical protein